MTEFLYGAAAFLIYVIPAAAVSFLVRIFLKIPDEIFRKILHFILLGAYIPVLFGFQTWWLAALFAIAVIIIFYPVLWLAGLLPAFSAFVNERKSGELKNSLILAFAMMAVGITVCWGLLNDKLLVLACVYAWGVGDAFAALIGKKYGKHKIHLPFADAKKSVEGSATMFSCSVFAVMTVLLIRGGLDFASCLLISLVAAAVTTYVERCTKGGYDTVTCPTAAMAVILPLVHILGG